MRIGVPRDQSDGLLGHPRYSFEIPASPDPSPAAPDGVQHKVPLREATYARIPAALSGVATSSLALLVVLELTHGRKTREPPHPRRIVQRDACLPQEPVCPSIFRIGARPDAQTSPCQESPGCLWP